MNVKEESEKVGLKLSIHKTKIMASGLITSWEIDGETVTDFILEGSTHSSILAWKIPWTKESGSLLSMGLQRVGHDWATSLSKITADGDFSHEMKRCLLLGRQAMTNLDRVLKSRNITLPTKFCLVKAMVFPVIMDGCESWTIKKSEHWRIDAFKLWCWRRFLRVPWTARRSNQSSLKDINLKYSLVGLILKLKL